MSDFYTEFESLDLNLHGVRLPSFEIKKEVKRSLKVSEDLNNYDFLRKICLDGFKKLDLEKGSEDHDAYVKRAKYELKTLKSLGFIDYVLLVWDVMNYCHNSDIPTGLGRGSAAGSLV